MMKRGLLLLLLCFLASTTPSDARQIRINRYGTSEQNDRASFSDEQFRRAVRLADEVTSQNSDISVTEMTTDATSTTADGLSATMTAVAMSNDATKATPAVVNRAGHGRALVKAPYPAAGYRPSRAFNLPTELNQRQKNTKNRAAIPSRGNDDNPICGVSVDPLKPTPKVGATNDPDAESVIINATVAPSLARTSVATP